MSVTDQTGRHWRKAATRYVPMVRWILEDLVRPNRRAVALCLAIHAAAILLEVAGLAWVLTYINAAEHDWTVSRFGQTIQLDGTQREMLLFGLVALAILVVAGLVQYASHVLLARVCARYNAGAMRRLVTSVLAAEARGESDERIRELLAALAKTPHFLSMASYRLLRLAVPLVGAVLCAGGMLFLAPGLTIAAIGVYAVLTQLIFYLVSFRLRGQRRQDRGARRMGLSGLRDLVDRSPLPDVLVGQGAPARIAADLTAARGTTFVSRLQVLRWNDVSHRLSLGIMLLMIALYFGPKVAGGHMSVAALALYLLMARYFSSTFSHAASLFARINVSTREFETFATHMRDGKATARRAKGPGAATRTPSDPGILSAFTVHGFGRHGVEAILKAADAWSGQAAGPMALVHGRLPKGPLDLAAILIARLAEPGAGPAPSLPLLTARVSSAAQRPADADSEEEEDEAGDEAGRGARPLVAERTALSALAAVRSNLPLVAIDAEDFALLEPGERTEILSALVDRRVVMTYRTAPPRLLSPSPHGCLYPASRGTFHACAAADYPARREEIIAALLSNRARAGRSTAADGEDDDDWDDD